MVYGLPQVTSKSPTVRNGTKILYRRPSQPLTSLPASHLPPWENGYCESFNSKLRDEFLNGEIFYSLKEVQILAERWRVHYNTIRPHSSLGYRSPAPETWQTEIKTGYGEVESKVRFPLPPHPRRRRDTYKTRCATLTLQPVQKIGHSSYHFSIGRQSVQVPCWTLRAFFGSPLI